MSNRWVAIDPDILTHPLVGAGQAVTPADPSRGAYSRMEAWVWIICNASFADHTVMNRGRKMTLQRGDLLGAWLFLAHQWNWSQKTVRIWVEKLVADNMLKKKTVELQIEHNEAVNPSGTERGMFHGNQAQVLSVHNYWRYQFERYNEGQPIGQPEGQPKGSQTATKGQHITKEQEEEREIGAAGAHATEEAERVQVNGVAIYGPGFKLDFAAIDMAADLVPIDRGKARALAEICARDWAINKTKPHNPMAMFRAALRSEHNQSQIHDVRLGKAASRAPATTTERFNKYFKDLESDDKGGRVKS